jgi:hypothetical protein
MAQSQQSEGSAASSGKPDDIRQRFREALDRKNAQAKAGEDHTDTGSRAQDAHGRLGGKREFRRKSG